MKGLSRKIILLIITIFIAACKKQSNGPMPGGTYSGRFIYDDSRGFIYTHKEGVVTVTFNALTYSSTRNTNYFPAGGSGTYTVNNNEITFTDNNVYTANFNWDLILNGSYIYSYKNDTLIITKQVGGSVSYQYRIKKN